MTDRTPTVSIVMAHSFYREPGGENLSFEAEAALLAAQEGVELRTFTRAHDREQPSAWEKIRLAPTSIWSRRARKSLEEMLHDARPDLVHFQNTFPLLSPSVYEPCADLGVPVVQHLRNYRLLCPSANFYRDRQPCEDCLAKKIPWPGVMHGCYQESRVASAGVATMLSIHNLRNTWSSKVDAYVTPTEFTRSKYIAAGFDPSKIHVKPNFVSPDPGLREGTGSGALFVGRLAPEKGVETMLRAWREIDGLDLAIIGDGPLMQKAVQLAAPLGERVSFLGTQPNAAVLEAVKRSAVVIFPSEWYETFGRVVIEALACGVPVITADMGAMRELIIDKQTGLTFRAGDPASLAAAVQWALEHPADLTEIARAGRRRYETTFTAEANLLRFKEIYATVLGREPWS